jgi:hypothetical protein
MTPANSNDSAVHEQQENEADPKVATSEAPAKPG